MITAVIAGTVIAGTTRPMVARTMVARPMVARTARPSIAGSAAPRQQLVIFHALLGRKDFLRFFDFALKFGFGFLVNRVDVRAIILLDLLEVRFLLWGQERLDRDVSVAAAFVSTLTLLARIGHAGFPDLLHLFLLIRGEIQRGTKESRSLRRRRSSGGWRGGRRDS